MIPGLQRNGLLALCSEEGRDALVKAGVIVDMLKGRDITKAGQKIEYCWFPLSGMASVIAEDHGGNQTEVGLIGYEGMINSSVLVGSEYSDWRVHTQITGTALRLSARKVQAVVQTRADVRSVLIGFDHALAAQAAIAALVNARYTIASRLARVLLMCADRVGEARINVTHEELSMMLGVQRSGVTIKLNKLISCAAVVAQRGFITITDRKKLLAIAGNSYGLAEEAYERRLKSGRSSRPRVT